MKFEWDERKNQSNLIKHGFDFAHAPGIFNSPMLVELDDREDYGEDRWIGIGLLSGRVVVVVYTELEIVVAGVYPLQINFSSNASQICPPILR